MIWIIIKVIELKSATADFKPEDPHGLKIEYRKMVRK